MSKSLIYILLGLIAVIILAGAVIFVSNNQQNNNMTDQPMMNDQSMPGMKH